MGLLSQLFVGILVNEYFMRCKFLVHFLKKRIQSNLDGVGGGWGLVHCIVLNIKYILQFNFITHSYVQTYFIDVSVSV